MRNIADGICRAHGATCDFLYTHEFAPTVNWDEPVEAVIQAAGHVVGTDKVNADWPPLWPLRISVLSWKGYLERFSLLAEQRGMRPGISHYTILILIIMTVF